MCDHGDRMINKESILFPLVSNDMKRTREGQSERKFEIIWSSNSYHPDNVSEKREQCLDPKDEHRPTDFLK